METTNWEPVYSPTTEPRYNEAHGINIAAKLCKYYSPVYHLEKTDFENLQDDLREDAIAYGQHYEQFLRHPGDQNAQPNAETPAEQQKTEVVKDEAFDAVIDLVQQEVKQEKTRKAPPPKPAEMKTKGAPPIAHELEKKERAAKAKAKEEPYKPPPIHLQKTTADNTAPPPAPPKRNTDKPVQEPAKKLKTEPVPPPMPPPRSTKNKISSARQEVSSASSSTNPTPIPPPAPEKVHTKSTTISTSTTSVFMQLSRIYLHLHQNLTDKLEDHPTTRIRDRIHQHSIHQDNKRREHGGQMILKFNVQILIFSTTTSRTLICTLR